MSGVAVKKHECDGLVKKGLREGGKFREEEWKKHWKRKTVVI